MISICTEDPACSAGKNFVVTGGTQGVGRATALRLASMGAKGIAICGRSEEGGAEVERELRDAGAETLFVRADLALPEDCFAVVDKAADRFGTLDGLINCAGVYQAGTLDETSSNSGTTVRCERASAVLLSQRIVGYLRSQGGGTIVNIGSVAAHCGQPYITGYSAAKAAVLTLTRNMANALKWDRIRVNALNIGWTATPTEHDLQANYHGLGEDWLEKVEAVHPSGDCFRRTILHVF